MVVQTFNLQYLIFEQILRFSPNVLAKYATLTDKLLYLILIPHIVLLLFLFSFGMWAAKDHKGFQMLISIAGYLVIVLSGWYGSFLAPFISNFFLLWLALAFITFIAVRVIPPIFVGGVASFGGEVAKRLTKASVSKEKQIEALQKEKENVRKMIAKLKAEPQTEAISESIAKYLELERKIEEKIEELEE
ncbi:MAG: hypothetical protein QXU82_01535 [Candidatus Aenigmatarchaeota archaeon]